jgi:hypothetical protein
VAQGSDNGAGTRRSPSATLVVALVALSFAVAGSALAGTEALKRAVSGAEVKRVAKRQAVKAFTARERQLIRGDAIGAGANASAAGIDDFTTPTYTTVLEEPFRAPRAATVLITSSVGAADDATLPGPGLLATRVAVDGNARFGDPFNSPTHVFYNEGSGGSATNTVVVPVSAGDHTAQLQIREAGNGSFVFTTQISVVVLPRR